MGSFSYTCAISGLPIEEGDAVRYYLLTENPYDSNIRCSMTDLWFPRTWPLKGIYNNYGSVEKVAGEAEKQLWLDSLRLDLVERGWGANSCHDVPTSKDMSFDQLLEAAWEGRILVSRDVDMWAHRPELQELLAKAGGLPKSKQKIPKGIPTRKRVERILKQAGVGDTLIVRSDGPGRVSVQSALFHKTTFATVQELLSGKYATMLTVDRDGHHTPEVLVGAKLGVDSYYPDRKKGKDKPLKVAQSMIREDVWQALCQIQYKTDWGVVISLEKMETNARDAWVSVTSAGARLANGAGIFTSDPIPFTVGTGRLFEMMGRKYTLGEVKEEEVAPFLRSAAEFLLISQILANVRYQWRPSYSNGPQFGEYPLHALVQEKLSEVTIGVARRDADRRKEWENE